MFSSEVVKKIFLGIAGFGDDVDVNVFIKDVVDEMGLTNFISRQESLQTMSFF